MPYVRVVVLKDFVLEGQAVYAGQAIQLMPIEASIRARHGYVSLDPQMRDTYQTRDMVSAAVPVPVVVLPVEAPTTRRRGRPRKSKSLSV